MAAKSLALDQMYRVLRGLPGELPLTSPDGGRYVLTVVNPNAPANRCQETLGLSVTLYGPLDSPDSESVTRALSEDDLDCLRSGRDLPLSFGGIHVCLRSNPGGYLINLDE